MYFLKLLSVWIHTLDFEQSHVVSISSIIHLKMNTYISLNHKDTVENMTLFAKKGKFLLKVKDRKKRTLDFWKLMSFWEFCIYFNGIHSLHSSKIFPLPYLPNLSLSFFFFLHWDKVVLPKYFWIDNIPLEGWSTNQGQHS